MAHSHEELTQILTAAKAAGVTRLRFGETGQLLEVELSPPPPASLDLGGGADAPSTNLDGLDPFELAARRMQNRGASA